MSFNAVLFDLDGTLLDTAPDFITSVNQLRREENAAPLPEDRIRRTVSNGARALVSMAFDIGFDDPQFHRLFQRLLEIYSTQLANDTALFPGLSDLLIRLGEAGVPWGIVTNKSIRYTQPILDALQLSPAPGAVVCPDHVSNTKPDPEPLLLACKQLNRAPEQAIYVGDHQRDIDCGKRAGSLTVAAAYGYVDIADDPRGWGADHIADTPHDLAPIIFNYLR